MNATGEEKDTCKQYGNLHDINIQSIYCLYAVRVYVRTLLFICLMEEK